MRRVVRRKATETTTGIFSQKLIAELQSLLTDEFDRKITNDAELQKIGIRLTEFVAIKERRRLQKEHKQPK